MLASQRPRQIMEYVRTLEDLVRGYRAERIRFNLNCYFLGFLSGAAVAWVFSRLHAG